MITEDIAKLLVEIESSSNNKELMNELTILQQKTGALKDENKRLVSALEILRAQGKQNSDEFKRLKESYDANSKSIKENDARMKTLRQTMNNTFLSANDLRKKAKELQQELNSMVKEADPERWNRVAKELKGVYRQLREVEAGTKDTGSAMGNLMSLGKKLLPAFGLVAGIGLIKQLGSAFIDTFKSVQATGDAWAVTVAGMNAGWDYFKRSLVTTDWSNFFTNIAEGIKMGREYEKVLQQLESRNRSYKIVESEYRKEISAWQTDLKKIGNTKEEQIAIADKIIAKEDDLLQRRKKMAETAFNTFVQDVERKTKLSQEEIVKFMQGYEDNLDLEEQAVKYAEKLKSLEEVLKGSKPFGGEDNEFVKKIRQELNDEFSEEVRTYKIIRDQYGKSTKEELDKVADALVSLNNATTEYNDSTRKVEVRKSHLLGEDENDQKKSTEKDYNDEITAAENRNRKLRAAEVKRYEQKEIDEKALKAEMESLEDDLIRRKLAINKKYGKDTGALEDQLLARAIKRADDLAEMTEEEKQKQYDKDLKTSEDFYREERKKQNKRYLQGEIDQEQYNDGLKSLEQLFLQEKLALNIQYGKDTAAIEDQLAAYQIKCYEDVQKALAGIREKENKEKSAREKQLETEAAAIIAELRGQSIRETMNLELEQLEKLYNEQKKLGDKSLLSEQQYEQKKLKIKLSAAQKYAQMAAQLAQAGADLVSALQDAEYSNLEAQKEKELALAGDDAEKRKQIEEDYEAKKLEVQKKYADLDMAVKIAQTIAAGALAVIQAWGQLGPVAGVIMAAIVATTTALQISSIVQQRNAIKNMSPGGSGSSASTSQRVVLPGREEGGYVEAEREQDGKRFRARRRRRRGYVEEPTVLTGEAGPEYVAPAEAVNNPTIRPVLDIIEIARNNGTLSSINLPRLLGTARMPGMAAGGYTGTPAGTATSDATIPSAPSAADKAFMGLLAETRDIVKELKDNGVKAYMFFTEFEKRQTFYTKTRDYGSR